jgi:MFS family permease
MSPTPSILEMSERKHVDEEDSFTGSTTCSGSNKHESIFSSRTSLFKSHHISLGFKVERFTVEFPDTDSVPAPPIPPRSELRDTLHHSDMEEIKRQTLSKDIGHHSLYMTAYDEKEEQPLPQVAQAYIARESGLTYSYFGGRSETTFFDDHVKSAHYRNESIEDSIEEDSIKETLRGSFDDPKVLHSHPREPSIRSTSRIIHVAPPPPTIQMSTFREVMFIGVVAISHFVTQFGLGVNLAPLDIISETFRITNPGQQAWMIAGYSLTVGTFILIAGRMGDIWGHKRMLAFGYAWFGVWSGFAGFSAYTRGQILFDICRALQGIGPALIMPNGLALFGRAYPPGIKKNIVFSIFGAVAPAGFVVGAVFGSLYGQLVWWPWAFWSFGIVLWILAALALLVVPRELSGLPTNPPGFDWTGSFVGVAGLVLINVAWNNGPLYGWGTPHVYFLLVIGLLCIGAFFWVEVRADHPIVPVKALNGTVGFILAILGLGWGAFGVWVFYSFRFLAQIRLASPLSAAAQFAPASVCGFLAAGATAFMLTHTPVSFVMLVSMVAFTTGIIITSTMPAIQSYWPQMFVSVIIMPFGMDMSFPAASVILSNHMGPEHQGLAMSLLNTVVNYSISIALGIAGTVEVQVVDHSIISQAELLKGYRAGFYAAVALSGSGLLCGLFFFVKTMRQEGWKVMAH